MRRYFLRAAPAVLLAGAALAAPVPVPAEPGLAASAIRAGSPLDEALATLAAAGLELLWSSAVVSPGLRVAETPRATEPRAILDELLAPHGLTVETRGATLVVVRAEAPAATLRGSVLSRLAREPLAGVEVRVVDTDRRATSGLDGRFEIAGLAGGEHRVEARRPGFVIDEPLTFAAAAGGTTELELLLQPAPFSGEEIVVQPSRVSLLVDDPASPLALSREEIAALPHLAGDLFRALDLLPGAVSNDLSAQVQVRGGRRDETVVLVDGQEIYDAYHLKEYDNALSIVAAPAVDLLRLSTGAQPASRGDRMGGALELTTLAVSAPTRFRLAASLIDLGAQASGRDGDRSWLVSGRYGDGALAGALFGEEEPTFWDLFGKGEIALGESQSLRLSLLGSADRLEIREVTGGESRHFDTEYGSSYVWLTHQALWSDHLYSDSNLSWTAFDRDRRGAEDEEEKAFTVRDERDVTVWELEQSWGLQASPRNAWSFGFEGRRYTADYDYASERAFFTPLAELRSEPRDGDYAFAGRVRDDSLGAWLALRSRPTDRLTLELGGRADRHTDPADTVWSPRAALAWALGERTVLRLAAGGQSQTQRAYELMVTDGDTALYPVERATQESIGLEHHFEGAPAGGPGALRIELYRQRISSPRPRYESLFEPIEPFVEGELDRVRIEPERGRSEGAELLLRARPGERFDWFLSYAWARAEDRLDGDWTPRQIDQEHTVNADLNFRLGRAWSLNLAWRWNSGRPTTPISLRFEPVPHDPGEPPDDPDDPDEGEGEEARALADHELVPHPELGALNSARLPDYHRLDLRLSREWRLERGRLSIFFDAQNVYDRENVAGYDLELDDEESALVKVAEPWPGFLASAGISWEF